MPDFISLDSGKTLQLPQADPERPITVHAVTGKLHYKDAPDPWENGTPLANGESVTLNSQHWLTALGTDARVVLSHGPGSSEERPQRSLTLDGKERPLVTHTGARDEA